MAAAGCLIGTTVSLAVSECEMERLAVKIASSVLSGILSLGICAVGLDDLVSSYRVRALLKDSALRQWQEVQSTCIQNYCCLPKLPRWPGRIQKKCSLTSAMKFSVRMGMLSVSSVTLTLSLRQTAWQYAPFFASMGTAVLSSISQVVSNVFMKFWSQIHKTVHSREAFVE